jgi:UDP-glucuronate 4-epimerase
MTVLVTGVAGFVGMHVAEALLARGATVVGIDNLNTYYDPKLKAARLARLEPRPGFGFVKLDIAEFDALAAWATAAAGEVTGIVHLAAQAGVRYSLEKPFEYVRSNLEGHMGILEIARHHLPKLRHLVYASSSSVYGANSKVPFSTEDRVDRPVSLYAATKRADELLAEAYARLYALPQTGLRFFTVYGPWGRPDMAYYSFADAIAAGRPITLFNQGQMRRDFTWIGDVVEGVLAALDRPPGAEDGPPHRIYNLGNNQPVELLTFVRTLEAAMGQKADLRYTDMQPGDVEATYADIDATTRDLGWEPKTAIEAGLGQFVAWYRDYRRPAHAGAGA